MEDSTYSSDGMAHRKYDPYQGADLEYRARARYSYRLPAKTLYDLPTSPEFLFQEEAAYQRRSFGSNIQHFAGAGYLTGAILGATKGCFEGLRAAEHGESMKLRLNRVLNYGGQNGRNFGNRLGSIGLIYAGTESLIAHVRDTEDNLNNIYAGLSTGAIYRMAAGPRAAVVSAVVGGLTAGVAAVGSYVLKQYIPTWEKKIDESFLVV